MVIDGYSLATSDDQGVSFQPMMSFTELLGPLTCAPVQTSCAAHWHRIQGVLGIELRQGIPDGGLPTLDRRPPQGKSSARAHPARPLHRILASLHTLSSGDGTRDESAVVRHRLTSGGTSSGVLPEEGTRLAASTSWRAGAFQLLRRRGNRSVGLQIEHHRRGARRAGTTQLLGGGELRRQSGPRNGLETEPSEVFRGVRGEEVQLVNSGAAGGFQGCVDEAGPQTAATALPVHRDRAEKADAFVTLDTDGPHQLTGGIDGHQKERSVLAGAGGG
jgi:hypothetical protein